MYGFEEGYVHLNQTAKLIRNYTISDRLIKK